MKKHLPMLMMLCCLATSCNKLRKEPDLYLAANINSSTPAWTTSTINTWKDSNYNVLITATDKTTNEIIHLGIADYTEELRTYNLDPFSTGTIDVNWCDYAKGSSAYTSFTAHSGYITVTGITDGTLSGSFSFSDISHTITGTFTASKPVF